MLNKTMLKRYIFLGLSIMIAALIYWFSDQTATASSEDSEGLIWSVLNMIPYFAHMTYSAKMEILDSIHTLVRKTAHFSIYASLGICVFNYITTYVSARKKALLLSVGICFLYACTDEIHQLFVEGRSGEVLDVFIDTCGATAGICLVIGVMVIISKIRRCKSE